MASILAIKTLKQKLKSSDTWSSEVMQLKSKTNLKFHPWKIHRNEGVTSRDHLYSLSFIKKGGGEGEGLKKSWDLITSSPEKGGGGGELNRTLIISTTPRGQKKLISATTLSKKYDVLFHFFQVMPSTWALALNDFVFTAWVADF